MSKLGAHKYISVFGVFWNKEIHMGPGVNTAITVLRGKAILTYMMPTIRVGYDNLVTRQIQSRLGTNLPFPYH